MKVKVYFNLHSHKWSIKDIRNGLVLGHADSIVLKDVIPQVSLAGRERVLREKKKYVHAFLIGDAIKVDNFTSYKGRRFTIEQCDYSEIPAIAHEITYNPFKYDCFVSKLNGKKVESARYVELSDDNRRVFAVGVVCNETN